jgi:hypothetical protein
MACFSLVDWQLLHLQFQSFGCSTVCTCKESTAAVPLPSGSDWDDKSKLKLLLMPGGWGLLVLMVAGNHVCIRKLLPGVSAGYAQHAHARTMR